ncbi:MAG: hypothetical protein ACREOI_12800 [bacterium]
MGQAGAKKTDYFSVRLGDFGAIRWKKITAERHRSHRVSPGKPLGIYSEFERFMKLSNFQLKARSFEETVQRLKSLIGCNFQTFLFDGITGSTGLNLNPVHSVIPSKKFKIFLTFAAQWPKNLGRTHAGFQSLPALTSVPLRLNFHRSARRITGTGTMGGRSKDKECMIAPGRREPVIARSENGITINDGVGSGSA